MKNIYWFFILLISSLPSFLVMLLKAGFIHNKLIERLFIHDDSLDQVNVLGALAIWYAAGLIIGLYLDTKANFNRKE